MAGLPGAVLFACNLNCVRSPMAAGLMRQMHGRTTFVDSCGLRAGAALDPLAAAVMEEVGVDLARHRPKSFDELEDGSFDVVISLTPQAQHRAVELTRHSAVELMLWPTLDPTLAEGSREQRLDAYRSVRDELRRRLIAQFGRPSTFGG